MHDARGEAMAGYSALLYEVDRLAGRLSEHYRAHLVCRSGCAGCCRCDLSVFEVEAAAAETALLALPPESWRPIVDQAREAQERRVRPEPVSCPCLLDDRCAIYAARPVICRTQGLPLLYEIEDGAREVDFCPLNFTKPGATDELEEDCLVPLDRMNRQLAFVNLEFCRSQGRQTFESGKRTRMSDLVLSLDPGIK